MQKSSKKFEIEYRGLNKAQKEAVDTIEGPVLVVAGPGTGKTQVLTMRAGNILKHEDVRPGNILALTFTDSAAGNMQRRLGELVGKEGYRIAVHTFHSFGVDVIERYPEYFYGGASFYPADELVQYEVIEGLLSELTYSNPLSKTHPKEGYTYLKPVSKAIQALKKAGVAPEEFQAILRHNKGVIEKWNPEIDRIFPDRINKKTVEEARALAIKMESEIEKECVDFPVPYFHTLSEILVQSLKKALEQCEDEGKNTPLSGWKNDFTEKTSSGGRKLKEERYFEKMESLAGIYGAYGKAMYELGYYDFDDMLLEVIQGLKEHPELQHELWEQYQYILVDEFQDTNDAQMRLLYLLTEAEVMEERPNICVVGDDDQAIYKFQGALVSNILDFKDRYRGTKMVVLSENYRSTQDILDLAQFFIRKGDERLETLVPELTKELSASNTSLGKGDITTKAFDTDLAEYTWVAGEIRRLIDLGMDPSDIAVISRKHEQLETFSGYLSAQVIPTFYERNQNVFDQPHVRQLVQIVRFVVTLNAKNIDEADELLPEILSYPFWKLSSRAIWQIASEAERGSTARKRWLDVMLASNDKKIKWVAEFLLELARFSKSHTLLESLDLLIGEHITFETVTYDGEEVDELARDEEGETKKQAKRQKIKSPFRAFYFNEKNFEENRLEYMTFLSALQVFVSSIREYRHGKQLSFEDLVAFVDRHEAFDIRVTDRSPFVGGESAVTLLSAHKAKGLEYTTVFILSCQDNVWAGRGGVNKLPFPKNLPIIPESDSDDDHLRLFFVAVTRAKEKLYMTSYQQRSDGKHSIRLRFLQVEDEEVDRKIRKFLLVKKEVVGELGIPDSRQALFESWRASHTGPYIHDEDAMLRKLLQNYQMSATHLNNFLDVPKGGPRYYLEQSLLHFPQAKSANMSYGTAMHAALEGLYKNYRFLGELPKKKDFIKYFTDALLKERLGDRDFKKWKERGEDALSVYYDTHKAGFDSKDQIEKNFKNEGVLVEGAHLTGKVDKIVKEEERITVVDFKTGKVAKNWKGAGEYEKQKLFRYKNQLLFYKILVENSKTYGEGHTVDTGVLDFLEPNDDGVSTELSLELTRKDADELIKLIGIVYEKISNLDFPDTSEYADDMEGTFAFKADLLDGRV